MVNFKSIYIKNFMSIGESTVDLNTGGFTLITAINNRVEDSAGSNGSGKSSIAEAILWCLTGETIRGHKEVVNRYTEGDCEVRIEFNFKGYNWAVERSMSRSKEKSLLVYKDSSKLEAKGYRDAQDVLQKELPELTPKFINSVIILGQGLPGRFTNNTPSGRKAVLEELTNADFMITQIKDSIKNRFDRLNIDLRSKEDDLLRFNTQIEVINSRLKSDKDKLSVLGSFNLEAHIAKRSDLSSKVDKLSTDLKINEQELVKFLDLSNQARDEWKDQKSKLDSEVSARNSKLVEDLSGVKDRYSNKLAEETLQLKERMLKGSQLIKEVEDQIQHNKAKLSGGVCRTCGQRLTGVSESDLVEADRLVKEGEIKLGQYKDLYRQLQLQESNINVTIGKDLDSEVDLLKSQARLDIEKITNTYTQLIQDLERKYNQTREESNRLSLRRGQISQDLELTKEALSSVSYKIDNHQKEVDSLNLDIFNLESDLNSTKASVNTVELEIESLRSKLSIVKQMETFASRDFRGILLEGIISRMDDLVGGYSEVVYGNRLTRFYLNGNSVQIEFDGKEYESLSGGEQQKINVILQLSLRDLIIELTGNTGSILFLDEIFDGLDSVGCEKMVDLIQRIDLSSVFIISHRVENLFIPYDHIITVIKNSNGVAHIEKGV